MCYGQGFNPFLGHLTVRLTFSVFGINPPMIHISLLPHLSRLFQAPTRKYSLFRSIQTLQNFLKVQSFSLFNSSANITITSRIGTVFFFPLLIDKENFTITNIKNKIITIGKDMHRESFEENGTPLVLPTPKNSNYLSASR